MAQSLADLAREQAEKKRVADAASKGLAAAAPKEGATVPTPPTTPTYTVDARKSPAEEKAEASAKAAKTFEEQVAASREKTRKKKEAAKGSLR